MEKKIPIQNRFFALILSLLFSITLLISLFALPIELVMFNQQSYIPVLENDENQTRYPEIISQVLVSELYRGSSSDQLPKIFSNRAGLQTAFKKSISSEWSLSVFKDLSNQVLDYLNFRIPNSSFTLEISQLKSALILKSEKIALDYVSTLPRCSAAINESFSANKEVLDIAQLPPCKPSEDQVQAFINPTTIYIEDIFNRLPEKASLSGVIPFDRVSADKYFYYYSLGRWVLRLLPIVAIGLLIIITLLLQAEKAVMLKWVGRLLVFISGLGLIGLVILLIGFDQFVVLLINRHLNNFIEGFGILLLGLIQKVGYLTLVWVIISLAAVFTFGLFLLIVNRFLRSKVNSTSAISPEDDALIEEPNSDPSSEEIQVQKEIIPETLEEIEAQEKKNSKKKNLNNPAS
jgi:hypothetical protein